MSDDTHRTSRTPHEPHIQVLKGKPTDEEVAALIAVLGGAGGGGGEPGQPEPTRWGLPVDKLRYSVLSWQRITLLQRTHMRGDDPAGARVGVGGSAAGAAPGRCRTVGRGVGRRRGRGRRRVGTGRRSR